MKRTYVLEYERWPLATYTSMAKAQATIRALAKNWRQHGVDPLGGAHPVKPHTAIVLHGHDTDGRAEGGLWFQLRHRGAVLGHLRIVRAGECPPYTIGGPDDEDVTMLPRVTLDDLFPRAGYNDEPLEGIVRMGHSGACWVCGRRTLWVSRSFEAAVCSMVCDHLGRLRSSVGSPDGT